MLSQLLMIGLAMLGVRKSTACLAATVVLVVAFLPMLYFLFKADKHRRIADERDSELALVAWQQGETDGKNVVAIEASP
ncbi:MAG TPA: hypothetical protein VE890_15875 [Thermoguttaceae bacterium]|nr:hypothetical protein [Thermoguttaceae bacterium]